MTSATTPKNSTATRYRPMPRTQAMTIAAAKAGTRNRFTGEGPLVGAAELQQEPLPLSLAVATGDRERFTWLVEKSVELGVTRIVPLETARTASVATRLKPAHVDRQLAVEMLELDVLHAAGLRSLGLADAQLAPE